MSINSLLYPNFYNLNTGTISIKGKSQGGVKFAPIVTESNVLVANLYAARALVSDASFGGNISGDSLIISGDATINSLSVTGTSTATVFKSTTTNLPPLIINSTQLVGNLYCENAMHSDDSAALQTSGSSVNVSSASPPTVGQALVATAATTATWQDLSITPGADVSGNVVTANVFTSPVINGTTINATTVNSTTFNGNLVGSSVTASGTVSAGTLVVSNTSQVSNLKSEFSGTADIALALKSATTTVNVSSATAPSVGQTLVATGASTATWQSVPASSSAAALDSATTTVNVDASAAPTAGQVLVATSDSAAVWTTLASSNAFTYSTTATAAGTTTLTTSATYYNFWTGSTTQTILLPGTGTATGSTYVFKNLSSGDITLQAADASALIVLSTNDIVKYCCITADAATNTDWSQVI